MTKKKKKPPKYALLIWEVMPERTEFYLLPIDKLTSDEKKWLRRCHANFIGNDIVTYNDEFSEQEIDAALTMVSELLADPHADWLRRQPGYFKEQAKKRGMKTLEFQALYGSWRDYRIDLTKPKTIPRARIVNSGFFQ